MEGVQRKVVKPLMDALVALKFSYRDGLRDGDSWDGDLCLEWEV